MKTTAVALRDLGLRVALNVGLEGTFLILGTICLAIGSSYLWAFGPWLVIGFVSIIAGLALAVPRRQ